jgi:hypothetical protein
MGLRGFELAPGGTSGISGQEPVSRPEIAGVGWVALSSLDLESAERAGDPKPRTAG